METYQIVLAVLYCIPVAIGLFLALSLGLLAMGFTGDYSNSVLLGMWNGFRQFVVVAVGAVIWPISLPILAIWSKKEEKATAKRNAEYEANLAKGVNYGKVYRIKNSPEFLRNAFVDGHLIKVIKWDEDRPLFQAVENPIPGYPMSYRFHWSLDRTEEV